MALAYSPVICPAVTADRKSGEWSATHSRSMSAVRHPFVTIRFKSAGSQRRSMGAVTAVVRKHMMTNIV